MIGTGYVGLVSGVCFANFGRDVDCVDRDAAKIERLNAREEPIYEPEMDAVMARNVDAGRLYFTTYLGAAVAGAEAASIAVGTPTRRGDGHADLTFVMEAACALAPVAPPGVIVVTKSTVLVGSNRRVRETIAAANTGLDFDVASNPEFLREDAAIKNFMHPDRVVVCVETDRAA